MKHKFQFAFTIVTTCETRKDETGCNIKVGRTATERGGDEVPKDEKGELDKDAFPCELIVGAAAARKVEQLVDEFIESRAVKESIDYECDLAKLVFDSLAKKEGGAK